MGYKGQNAFESLSIDTPERELIGNDPSMKKVEQVIGKIACAEAPVIITGESGTGKELAAHTVHRKSGRRGGPFLALNCGALPANLIQSELFGYCKGAFTGAHRDKIGRLEAADGGTILLDEIGDLPLDLQVNLLRFLQEGTIDRIGGTEPVRVDVRVIAATHVDLVQAVRQGKFREDLFYRLNVLHLELPPLRERVGDIELLAEHFLRKFLKEHGGPQRHFHKTALQVMNSYPWPGNVRELINRVRRAAIMSEGRLVMPADLGLERRNGDRNLKTLAEVRAEAEKLAIRKTLSYSRNNISEAARQLKISRIYLYRLMEKHGLNPREAREEPSVNPTCLLQ